MPTFNVSDIASKSRGSFAHRAGSLQHFDDELLGLSQPELTAEEQEHDTEIAALAEIASLLNHPGYQKMRQARLDTIAHYRSGAFARELLTNGSITDAEFGAKMRVGLLVAEELEKELLTVEAADEAVEQEKTRKRNGRRRSSPSQTGL
jgi:hypothetical protein